jgi:cyclopropane fatty-acyl-phospholipid synthase-like methyltransferase
MDDDWLGRWERAYANGDLPWDIGRPQPAFRRLAESGVIVGPALDSGCGTGEHALLLASLGIETVGVDVSPTAVHRAEAKARDRGLAAAFVVGNVLDLGALGRTFRSVIDSGMFHTLDDDDRERYVSQLAGSVEQAGRVFLMCFSERTPGTEGPRRVTQAEIRAAFSDGWVVERIEPERFEVRSEFMRDAPHAWLATIARSRG